VLHEADKDIVALLWAMKERHDMQNHEAPLSEGTHLAPELVAERTGLTLGRCATREQSVAW
jgi:hypothetical protein